MFRNCLFYWSFIWPTDLLNLECGEKVYYAVPSSVYFQSPRSCGVKIALIIISVENSGFFESWIGLTLGMGIKISRSIQRRYWAFVAIWHLTCIQHVELLSLVGILSITLLLNWGVMLSILSSHHQNHGALLSEQTVLILVMSGSLWILSRLMNLRW